MTENPYEPTIIDASLKKRPSRFRWISDQPAVWTAVVVIAVLAGISSTKVVWYRGKAPSTLFEHAGPFVFWLGPPLAILIVIMSSEMRLRRQTYGKAFYNAAGFCLYCIGFLILGYAIFVPSCTGSTTVLEATLPRSLFGLTPEGTIAISTTVSTIVISVVMLFMHRGFRKGNRNAA